MDNKSLKPKKRIRELDSLRGIAAFGIVLFHYTSRYNQIFGHSQAFRLNFDVGFYGVNLFFIISGFVILMTIEKAKKPHDFVISRFARLYPSYWVAVIFTFLLVRMLSLPGLEVGRLSALINLTMLQSFFTVPNVDGTYWTLSVELIFYVLMTLVLLVKKNFSVEKVSFLALGVVMIFYFIQVSQNKILDVMNPYLLFIHYSNLFFAGMIFYRLKTYGSNLIRNVIIGLCLITQFIISTPRESIAIVIFFIIFYLLVINKLSFINNRLFLFLGAISYPLYLIHEYFGYIIIRQLYSWQININFMLIIPIIAAIVIAALIHHLVEIPGQRFIKNTLLKNANK